jgi:hypothetical protein
MNWNGGDYNVKSGVVVGAIAGLVGGISAVIFGGIEYQLEIWITRNHG